jgi:hypothetical protein
MCSIVNINLKSQLFSRNISKYRQMILTTKGQELVESVVGMLQWMRKWAKVKRSNNPIIVT